MMKTSGSGALYCILVLEGGGGWSELRIAEPRQEKTVYGQGFGNSQKGIVPSAL